MAANNYYTTRLLYLDVPCFIVFILGQGILSYKVNHIGTTLIIIVDYSCLMKMLLTNEVAYWKTLHGSELLPRLGGYSSFKVEKQV